MASQRRQRSARGSGAELRAEILAAARTLLAETGSAEAVSIRSIATAVGVTAPSIYRHFADKDLLIEAVCADVFADLGAVVEGAIEGITDPVERLMVIGQTFVRFARGHPEHYRISMMTTTDSATALDMVLNTSTFTHLASTMAECIEKGISPPGDPVALSLQAWSVVHGIASLQIAKPYLPWGDPDEAVDSLLRVFAAGMSALGKS